MKKFLSILLIAAAVFGIYADIMNVRDAFACKSYWEEKSDKSEADLNMLAAGLKKLKKDKKTYLKGVKSVAKSRKSLAKSEATYNAAAGKLSKAKKELKQGKKDYKKLVDLIKSISTLRSTYKTWRSSFETLKTDRANVVKMLNRYSPNSTKAEPETVNDLLFSYSTYIKSEADQKKFEQAVNTIGDVDQDQSSESYKNYADCCTLVMKTIDELLNSQKTAQAGAAALSAYSTDEELSNAIKDSPDLYNAAIALVKFDVVSEDDPKAVVDGAVNGSEIDLETIRYCATEPLIQEEIKMNVKNLKWIKLYLYDAVNKYVKKANTSYDQLLTTQDQMANGLATICTTISKNKTYRNGIKKLMGKQAVPFLEEYKGQPNRLSTSQASFNLFEDQMDTNPGIATILEKAQKYLTNEQTKAKKAYTTANTKYKRSLNTYKKTPAKLETARKKLATAEAKLTKYEDGEKTARKGLNDLMASEAEGGVTSVADRVGDEGFNDKNGKLDPGKGLDAVSAGEDYLNEVGDLVTKELTGRFIATALGAIAAALALLAGLLAILRSNRGGAVISCFAAIAGAAAAVYGNDAGMVFSELAGSNVGALPWIAAAVIAGVSLAFAAMHFAAKIEEK